MTNQHYGQFCGLARAAEIVGQRWTLLILRDLSVGPRRYSDLVAGLPGIPTNTLASRLKELEEEGLVTRTVPAGARAIRGLRPHARAARSSSPALDALSRWGAGGMRTPREGEIVTTASITAAFKVAAGDGVVPKSWNTSYTVHVADVDVNVLMRDGAISVGPGPADAPDLVDHRRARDPRSARRRAGCATPRSRPAPSQLEGDVSLFAPLRGLASRALQPERPRPAAEVAVLRNDISSTEHRRRSSNLTRFFSLAPAMMPSWP